MHKKKLLSVVLALALTLFGVFVGACTPSTGEQSSGTSYQYALNELSVTLGVDESFELQVLGGDGSEEIKWTTDNVSVAKVTNGVVTGIAPGKANIRVSVGGKTLQCQVTVSFEYHNAVYLTLENELSVDGKYYLTLLKGESYLLSPALIDGEKVENASFLLASESVALQISGLEVQAAAAVENAELTVSCTYEQQEYAVSVFVTVREG